MLSSLVLAYLGGVLTIASPCLWPVIPIVFAAGRQRFRSHGLWVLLGMALSFSVVAALASVSVAWVATVNVWARHVALALIALLGLTLLWPAAAAWLSRPFVAAGLRLAQPGTEAPPWLLGVATGLIWTPCAGPILALVLSAAALQGPTVDTWLMLLAYAAGAGTALGVALLSVQHITRLWAWPLRYAEGARKLAGAAVLLVVAGVALELDTVFLSKWSLDRTTALENAVTRLVQPVTQQDRADVPVPQEDLVQLTSLNNDFSQLFAPKVPSGMPSLAGATDWINSQPLSSEQLQSKVVLVEFWTYSCINCLRTLPYVRAWHDKYKAAGLQVLGVHTPEFAFERRTAHVQRATRNLGIDYPVAVDSDYAIWRAFGNRYWPALYVVDARGRIRHQQFGEGGYAETERVIQLLLQESGRTDAPGGLVRPTGSGVQAAPGPGFPASQETYVGYTRAERFVSEDGGLRTGKPYLYLSSRTLRSQQWTLAGLWTVEAEQATLNRAGGTVSYRFKARDLHMVLGPSEDGKPVRFRVRIDGKPPQAFHGADVGADGSGIVDATRLYQLVRQDSAQTERVFEIEFLDAGAQAYAFTFG
jgi:cytochrome c biogenesis protein CcdA/thiol-disulfide isomerase/thioredoxin